ncbi:hypothetical protein HOY82DRAFT_597182 [Tuber indicum]|nr:hypothetical protein HOY82DRAFT_597182 [Tuber indicum]
MPQIYNWESFHEILSELYLVDGLPLSRVMDIMKEKYEFSPSLRAYRDRFSQWEFTKRQISLHRNTALVTKVRELWTPNMSSANMLRCLSITKPSPTPFTSPPDGDKTDYQFDDNLLRLPGFGEAAYQTLSQQVTRTPSPVTPEEQSSEDSSSTDESEDPRMEDAGPAPQTKDKLLDQLLGLN